MNLPQAVVIRPEVMARQVGDEVVLLDLASGTYFGLDAVGARIWQLLAESRSVADVRDTMLAEYEVTREDLERDMNRLLDQLASQGLITIAGPV